MTKKPDQLEGDKSMMPLKQWVHEEAARSGVAPPAIYMRLKRGSYPGMRVRYVPGRGAFVTVPARFKPKRPTLK